MPRSGLVRSLKNIKSSKIRRSSSSLLDITCEHRVKRRRVGFSFPFLLVFTFPYFSELHCKPLIFVRNILSANLYAVQLSKCD